MSEVCFEIEVRRDRHHPGEYELEAVRAYPYELDGREDLIMEFEVRGEIRFPIAEELGVRSPRDDGLEVRLDSSNGFAIKVVGPEPLKG